MVMLSKSVVVPSVAAGDRTPGAPSVPPCPMCLRLLNFFETGEWSCPRCGGPTGEDALRLMTEYLAGR